MTVGGNRTESHSEPKDIRINLRMRELPFDLFTDNTAIGIFFIRDGMLGYVNRYLALTLGYEADEVSGKLMLKDIIHILFSCASTLENSRRFVRICHSSDVPDVI
jgi:PAS domain-containing protein